MIYVHYHMILQLKKSICIISLYTLGFPDVIVLYSDFGANIDICISSATKLHCNSLVVCKNK